MPFGLRPAHVALAYIMFGLMLFICLSWAYRVIYPFILIAVIIIKQNLFLMVIESIMYVLPNQLYVLTLIQAVVIVILVCYSSVT